MRELVPDRKRDRRRPVPRRRHPAVQPRARRGHDEQQRGGSYSPMDIHITRNDGEQEITRFSSQLPPGLTANLTGDPVLPRSGHRAARSKSGAQEEAEPSCPAASEIGHTTRRRRRRVGARVTPPGKVYPRRAPINGAPLSIVVDHLSEGRPVRPRDRRRALRRCRSTPKPPPSSIPAGAADPIPHIIKGIVIHVRDIHVYIDRNGLHRSTPPTATRMTFAATVDRRRRGPHQPRRTRRPSPRTTRSSVANCQSLAVQTHLQRLHQREDEQSAWVRA